MKKDELKKNVDELNAWQVPNKVVSEILCNYILVNKIGKKIVDVNINDDGFYVDFIVDKNISKNSLVLIEGKILKELSKNFPINAEFSSKLIKRIKLRDVSGIENETKKINRIFGFATFLEEDFEKKLLEIEEKEQRDHRKIGKEMDLFFVSEKIGKGFPIWLENGLILKNIIKNFVNSQEKKYGSSQIETPSLGLISLYETSGHYEHYHDNMFPKIKIDENETFMLRPMACPHHIIVYKRKLRSYRDLPIRISENVKQFRYERSGALIGLERVRAMELTDSHIFLREDQLENELKKAYNLISETLKKFEIQIDYIELAVHDPKNVEKYHGNEELWKKSEFILENFLKKKKIKYVLMKGEAAFYGPKIDIQIKTALNHGITVSTIQLDFLLSEKFNLSYVDKNNENIQPIMIHRGLIGTYERFISILLEQTKGNLPMWLSPQQAIIIPVNNELHKNYSKKLFNHLIKNNIRVKIDDSDERMSNKIRVYQKLKIKTILIVGDNEIKNNEVSYRFFGNDITKKLPFDKILEIYQD